LEQDADANQAMPGLVMARRVTDPR
jgi:hypothetical protein